MIKAGLKKLGLFTFACLVLLSALSSVSPVFAQPPGLGHGFYGAVKVGGEGAAGGTVISARIDGTEYGSCTVTTPGQYALIVQNDISEGATIDFYIDDQKADQTFSFRDGWTTELDLTALAPPVLFISSTGGGSVTEPGEGEFTYSEGTVVDLVATPADGHEFMNWTGDVGTIADLNASSTTITIQGDYSITATFVQQRPAVPLPFPIPCFIATAAYGTPTAEEIDVLREFRDVVLLESMVGAQLVGLYYRLSPHVADVIAGNGFLRTIVRELLVDPVVWMLRATGEIWRS